MKISKFEKKMLALCLLMLFFSFMSFWTAFKTINDHGGFRKVVVDVGKDIKSIVDEISE